MPNHIITHAANKNRHPGKPDLPAPQRSSQVVQEERAMQHAVRVAARHQQQESIRQVAEIEDQLHTQMKMRRTNFQNPKSTGTRSLKPPLMPKTAPDGAIPMALTLHHVPGHNEGGESQEAETEKASDTEPESTHSKDVYDTDPNVAMAGSEDEETVANQEAASKVVASIAPVLLSTGKCKLKREGAIYFGPSTQKKTKTDHPSGLTASDTYWCTHKDGKPADARHESHIEVQTGEHTTHRGDRVNAGVTDRFSGLSDEQEKKWQPARAQSTAGPIAITKIVANAPQERLQHSAPIANATTTRNQPSHQNLPKGSATQFTKFFIPLLRLYCGTLENPWMVPDRFVDKLQELWDKVMLDWPYWFDEDDDCMQKIYEWHTHIGKAGTEAVEALWASHPKYENPEEQKAYVDFALGRSIPFMYGSVEYLGANEYRVSKSFLSQLVLQTFASHIRDVSAVDNDTYHNLLDYAMPRGALVLAVTSVEQGFDIVFHWSQRGAHQEV
ncbi:hypothetical protein HD554DRAFT_2316347 [Boletus coccyginus]|nr:hypothetical protein HD554DRAFT_2316347 [Boletus coccyginus]